MIKTLQRLSVLAPLLTSAACTQNPPPASALAKAPYNASYVKTSVVAVFAGSDEGLIVGPGPLGHNPAEDLPGFAFNEHDAAVPTYLWTFAPGVKLLDRDCKPIDLAAAITFANGPGRKSAAFIDYLGPDGHQIAPAKMEIWNRARPNPRNCVPEEGNAK